MKPRIHLVTRADDAGSCRSANEAILECVEAGIIKNVSFMAVGPEIEHAIELLGGRDDIAYGLHVCLNAEWRTVKWGPLYGWKGVLTDTNGHYFPFPSDTKASIEHARSEMRLGTERYDEHDHADFISDHINAQFRFLCDFGLNISYVDEHMGVSWIDPYLRSYIAGLPLVDAHSIPSLPDATNTNDDFSALESRLKNATGDRYVWVTHPGKIAPDMNQFFLKGQQPGVVACERDNERRLLLDSRLPDLFAKWKIKPTRYDELKL